MAEGFQHIHPRKLHAKLMGLGSRAERAQASLDFLCGCTAASGGHLFLMTESGLCVAANCQRSEPGADVVDYAKRAWLEEASQPDANRTRTIDLAARRRPEAARSEEPLWRDAAGVAYLRHLLGVFRGARWVPVGIAVIEAGATLAQVRHAYIEAVSNAFIDSADVPGAPPELGAGS